MDSNQKNTSQGISGSTFTLTKNNTHIRNDGTMCYYHHDEPAVAKCVRCGKYLCQDCFDSYGVSKGKYAGQALCYDCTQQLISDDLAELEANKNIIKIQFILSLVGIGIGFILGLIIGIGEGNFISALVSAILMAGIGGVFLTFLKAYLVVALSANGSLQFGHIFSAIYVPPFII